jgi:hypothetical protein
MSLSVCVCVSHAHSVLQYNARSYPGVLALDNLSHFALKQEDLYKKLVLDQMSRDEEYICPLVQT